MYDKDKIIDDCIKIIREEKLTFFTDLCIYIEPSLSTLYEWELEKSEVIKSELSKNKIAAKKKMRNRWEDSDNATLQIAAYKLIADESELNRLVLNKVDSNVKQDMNIVWNETLVNEPDTQTKPGDSIPE